MIRTHPTDWWTSKQQKQQQHDRYARINDRKLIIYYREMYKIVIYISNIFFYNKIELHKYVLTFELLGIIENLL